MATVDSILKAVYHLTVRLDSTGGISIMHNRNVSTTTICPIQIILSDTPSKRLQTLCNGDKIPIYYIINKDRFSFTVPYMKGKDYAGGIKMDDQTMEPVAFDKTTGTFRWTTKRVPDGLYSGSDLIFSANLPDKK